MNPEIRSIYILIMSKWMGMPKYFLLCDSCERLGIDIKKYNASGIYEAPEYRARINKKRG